MRFARENLSFWEKDLDDVLFQLYELHKQDIENLERQKKEFGEQAQTAKDAAKTRIINKIAEIQEIIDSLS